MKKRKNASVFRQLVISYILFAIICVISLYVCMFGVLYLLSGGKLEALAPYELVDNSGTVNDLHAFTENGGWVERLDSALYVREVYGEKKDAVRSYTLEMLSEYLCTDNIVDTHTSAGEYRGFLKAVQTDGETEWYLMKIGRKTLNLTYSYQAGIGTDGGRSSLVIAALAAVLILFLINCLFMSAWLFRKIKQPLQKVIQGMEQVRKGTGPVRLDFKAQREFEQIRNSFNEMAVQLEHEKQEKKHLEEKKNRMLLELSHDIKTPVATIRGGANALEEGLVKPQDVRRYYRLIDQKAERVNTLVNEMFLLLKLEDADRKLHTEQTDLCELVRQISAGYYEEITKRGMDFQISIPDTPVYAQIDRREFQRVIENLLENVIKYNQTGTMAGIAVVQTAQNVQVIVRDDGMAVCEEIRPVLFDPFVRGDQARQTRGGTGLGLAIAYRIMEKHGGSLGYNRMQGENIFCASIDL